MAAEVNIGVNELQKAIKRVLNDTKRMTEDAMKRAIDQTTKETVSKIKKKAPVRTGKYAKGWTSKASKQLKFGMYGKTVYNEPRYMLVHLLQNGHGGPAPAGPHRHIPQDDETERLLEQNIEKEMQR